jgi:hypothetical protein
MGFSSSRFIECIVPRSSFGSDRGGRRRKHQRWGREEKEGDYALGKEGGDDGRRRRTTACWGVGERACWGDRRQPRWEEDGWVFLERRRLGV